MHETSAHHSLNGARRRLAVLHERLNRARHERERSGPERLEERLDASRPSTGGGSSSSANLSDDVADLRRAGDRRLVVLVLLGLGFFLPPNERKPISLLRSSILHPAQEASWTA